MPRPWLDAVTAHTLSPRRRRRRTCASLRKLAVSLTRTARGVVSVERAPVREGPGRSPFNADHPHRTRHGPVDLLPLHVASGLRGSTPRSGGHPFEVGVLGYGRYSLVGASQPGRGGSSPSCPASGHNLLVDIRAVGAPIVVHGLVAVVDGYRPGGGPQVCHEPLPGLRPATDDRDLAASASRALDDFKVLEIPHFEVLLDEAPPRIRPARIGDRLARTVVEFPLEITPDQPKRLVLAPITDDQRLVEWKLLVDIECRTKRHRYVRSGLQVTGLRPERGPSGEAERPTYSSSATSVDHWRTTEQLTRILENAGAEPSRTEQAILHMDRGAPETARRLLLEEASLRSIPDGPIGPDCYVLIARLARAHGALGSARDARDMLEILLSRELTALHADLERLSEPHAPDGPRTRCDVLQEVAGLPAALLRRCVALDASSWKERSPGARAGRAALDLVRAARDGTRVGLVNLDRALETSLRAFGRNNVGAANRRARLTLLLQAMAEIDALARGDRPDGSADAMPCLRTLSLVSSGSMVARRERPASTARSLRALSRADGEAGRVVP